jgi:AAHS family 4-hydroxybenzoate transporter-like MFS transporter
MSAALVGFGLGSWSGGWLGDRAGRRYALALAALVFALATVAASRAGGVWAMAGWRVLGGIGFGAAYSNALAMASEWLPERWRPVAVSTLSVGTPLGGTVAGWVGPALVLASGWRGTFVTFGLATLLLLVVILAVLRDSPSFLLAKGKTQAAAQAARRVLGGEVELAPDSQDGSGEGARIGVLHPSNLRLNIGVGIAFAAAALVAYGILNWTTTMLTARGFTLGQAGNVVSIAGITSMLGSVAAGMLTRRFGSRRVLIAVGAVLVVLLVVLAFIIQALPAHPVEQQRVVVLVMIGVAAAVFSAGIATLYVVMALGYPQSCRSAGIGFGIFLGRVGAIGASGFGGALLDLGHGSVLPFFGILTLSAILVSAAALVIDRHVPPARAT